MAYDSRSVFAVKGPLYRFRPWTAPKGMAVYEGKRGLGFRAVSGPEGTFRPYQRLDPRLYGGYLRCFDFWFFPVWFIHSRRRSYYLFFNYLSYYLYGYAVTAKNRA